MILPLDSNKELYKHYNLLNDLGKIKQIDPKSCSKWLKTLNLSPYYSFEKKLCSDGNWRIFIKTKL